MTNQMHLHAWYSPRAAELYGSSIYRSVDGVTEVEVCCVDPTDVPSDVFQWPDRVSVGLVLENGYIRTGIFGTQEGNFIWKGYTGISEEYF